MKITKQQLKQLIKEEMANNLDEANGDYPSKTVGLPIHLYARLENGKMIFSIDSSVITVNKKVSGNPQDTFGPYTAKEVLEWIKNNINTMNLVLKDKDQ